MSPFAPLLLVILAALAPGGPPLPSATAGARPGPAPSRGSEGGTATAPWGPRGHAMAARAAAGSLPATMPAFFRAAADQLEYLNPEPDRWRSRERTTMDEAFKYDHYIDLENVPPGALDEPDRFRFLGALYRAGIERPEQRVGFLPYRILELYERLVTEFALWRQAAPGPERRWIEERIVNDAGILGHYVTDGSNPHHATIHFNGWAEGAPNPRNFTTDRSFHWRFESAFVDANVSAGDVAASLPGSAARLPDVREAVMDLLRDSNGAVERLYELEQRYGFPEEGPADPVAVAFAVERLARGAALLRDLWWTAWLESATVEVGR